MSYHQSWRKYVVHSYTTGSLLIGFSFQCGNEELCHLRATCRTLKDHADPIVFRCVDLASMFDDPHVTENQIISLATGISRACDLARSLRIFLISSNLPASELSWPYFGHCDDLRRQLPSAISMLINITCFRYVVRTSPHMRGYISWNITDRDPSWLIHELIHAVAPSSLS
jgi:hypothetical protein